MNIEFNVPDDLYLRQTTTAISDAQTALNRASSITTRGLSEHQVKTTGVGSVRWGTPITFNVQFLQEPQFYYGCGMTQHPDPSSWWDPYAMGTIRQWIKSTQGAYTACYMSFRVGMDPIADAPGYVEMSVIHYLSFAGLAYKVLSGIDTDLSNMNPVNPY